MTDTRNPAVWQVSGGPVDRPYAETFLKYGLQKKHFTKRLYNHLHLHCGFIANFNMGGFYSTYFEAGEDTQRFFEHFCNHIPVVDYEDLHTAMREVYSRYRDNIEKRTEDDVTERLKLLGADLERANNDRVFAKKFLRELRI